MSEVKFGWSTLSLPYLILVWWVFSSTSLIWRYFSALMLSLLYLFPPVTTPWVGRQLADA